MHTPLIIMIHRVECDGVKIPQPYYDRNMVVSLNVLLKTIDGLLASGYQPGSIEEVIKEENTFHLSFDDGFIEHLVVAKELQKRYQFDHSHCSFAVSVGNSIEHQFTGMDVIYQIIQSHGEIGLKTYLSKIKSTGIDLESIKKEYIRFEPGQFEDLIDEFNVDLSRLQDQFLSPQDIVELSSIFQVIDHGYRHRDMTSHIELSADEIQRSKQTLESMLNETIDYFCYPEGKNNEKLWDVCRENGYKLALSISHDEGNPFRIGRLCINRSYKAIEGLIQ